MREVQAAPSDTHFSDQWALSRMGWEDAYGSVDPATQTIVAILDTGVAAGHPDLNGRLVDGESYVDGVPADTDANGHGTWMAGIVGAAVDNEAGIAGVSWGAASGFCPSQFSIQTGEGQDSDVIEGLVGCRRSRCRRGAPRLQQPRVLPGRCRPRSITRGLTTSSLVAATGNDGSRAPSYPAGDRGVMGVASTDHSDSLAAGSNSGPQRSSAHPASTS